MKATPTPPVLLFIAGLTIIPTIMWQPHTVALAVQVLILTICAYRAGKRVRLLYFIVLIISVTFFHLLSPFGKLLYSFYTLQITEGALVLGLRKGLVFTGLVVCSLCTIRKELHLPGRFGRSLSRLFWYLELFMEHKRTIKRRTLLASIDTILLNALHTPSPHDEASPPRHQPFSGRKKWYRWHRALVLAAPHWILFFIGRHYGGV